MKTKPQLTKTVHLWYEYIAKRSDAEAVVADPVYGTKKNRVYLKDKGIRYAGKALGRPKKVTEQNREQLKRDKQ